MVQTPGELAKTQIKLAISAVSDSGGLRWALRTCMPNKFPDNTDGAGLRTF